MSSFLSEFFFNQCSVKRRLDGSLVDSALYLNRTKSLKSQWRAHWTQCHEFLRTELASYGKLDSIMILGSGALKETPIELIEPFTHKIYLADWIHPREIMQRYARYSKVQFLKIDLSKELPQTQVDLTISANLLSQLPRQKLHLLKLGLQQNFVRFQQQVQLFHLDCLRQISNQTILWTDYEVSLYSVGKLLESERTLCPAIDLDWMKTWNWQLEPYSTKTRTEVKMKIGAFSKKWK